METTITIPFTPNDPAPLVVITVYVEGLTVVVTTVARVPVGATGAGTVKVTVAGELFGPQLLHSWVVVVIGMVEAAHPAVQPYARVTVEVAVIGATPAAHPQIPVYTARNREK